MKQIQKAVHKIYNIYKERKIYHQILADIPIAEQIFDAILKRDDFDQIKRLANQTHFEEIKNFVSRLSNIGYIDNIPPLKKTPSITVVIPHYNHTDYLKEALDSLVQQTVKPDEVLVIDDLSPNIQAVKELCKQYETKLHLKLVLPKEKLYPGKARQLGAEMATSDVITTHDADDISHPNRIESTKHFFTMYPDALHLNFGIVRFKNKCLKYVKEFSCSDIEDNIIDTTRITNTMKKHFLYQHFSSFNLKPIRWGGYGIDSNQFFITHAGHVTYRKELVSRIKWITPFDKSFCVYEDYDFNFMLLMAGQKSFIIDLPLIYYREDSSSFILSKKHENIKKGET